MKTYDVTIQATVTKIIRVEAENEDHAFCEAQEDFDVFVDGGIERYEEETLSIKEVTA